MSNMKEKEGKGPSPHGFQVLAGTVSRQTVAGFQSGPFRQPIDITYPLPPSSGECLAFPNPPNMPCTLPDLDSPTIMFAPHFHDDAFEAALYPPPMVTHFMLNRLAEVSKVLTDTLVSAHRGRFSDIETTTLRMHLFNAHLILHYVRDVAVHADYVQDNESGVEVDNGA
ncbi:uncharacterized protein EV420DRAFT_1541753, partial [Desarmillaria tabescens]